MLVEDEVLHEVAPDMMPLGPCPVEPPHPDLAGTGHYVSVEGRHWAWERLPREVPAQENGDPAVPRPAENDAPENDAPAVGPDTIFKCQVCHLKCESQAGVSLHLSHKSCLPLGRGRLPCGILRGGPPCRGSFKPGKEKKHGYHRHRNAPFHPATEDQRQKILAFFPDADDWLICDDTL